MNGFDTIIRYYTYSEFVKLTESLLSEGKTTGPDQSEAMIGYTRLNLHRMHRWEKTYTVPGEIKKVMEQVQPQTWWIITEAWCGDSSQLLTQLYRLAETSNGKIDLRIILRDEHNDIMDRYLTNGSRSIPKLVALDQYETELFSWGPRPAPVQKLVTDWKANHAGRSYDDIKKEVHFWYSKDNGKTLEQEITALLQHSSPGLIA
jgi:hypothetical protein